MCKSDALMINAPFHKVDSHRGSDTLEVNGTFLSIVAV